MNYGTSIFGSPVAGGGAVKQVPTETFVQGVGDLPQVSTVSQFVPFRRYGSVPMTATETFVPMRGVGSELLMYQAHKGGPWELEQAQAGLGGCGCQGAPAVGASPDGLGAITITDYLTGSVYLDAAIGAGIGYLLSPRADSKPMYAGLGAAAGAVAGTLGLIGIAGLSWWVKKNG